MKQPIRVSTLSTGDELICGRIVDSNAAAIAAALLEQGLRVWRHMTVGDCEADIISALDALSRVSDMLIVTGGLGPTADDITARAAAVATGQVLQVNQEARAHIRHVSGKLANLIYCPLNDKQALMPKGSTLIPNPVGTACGFQLLYNGCRIFFLPGVPREMKRMLHDTVIPVLCGDLPERRTILSQQFNVFGPCEAEVDELLTGVASPEQGLQMGICVSFPAMQITLRAECETREKAEALLAPAARSVRERLGDFIYSEGEGTLDETLAALFRQSGRTLSTAESCTGGMIAQQITTIPGSSAYFLEGAVTYSNAAKSRQLGVNQLLLAERGAVSREVAEAMATGIRTASGSDLGLAVTGIAGPDGGSEDKPVGTVFVALASSQGCRSECFRFGGSREEIRTLTLWTALDWLRRHLLAEQNNM